MGRQPHAQQSCDPQLNPVVCENQLPGNPASEWDVSGGGNSNLQGFATAISVNKGETVHFKVDTTLATFNVTIYRLGYYGGDGARKIAAMSDIAGTTQPPCLTDAETGLVDCGNWSESVSWAVPASAVSGIYIARLSSSGGEASHIPFVVRDDGGNADVLFQTSDTTWQAYNTYGGNSLYTGGPGVNPGRAYKVSYNRPFTTRGTTPVDFLFTSEYPMVRWLEANGFNVSYASGIDVDRNPRILDTRRVFASVGHDEYWSGQQRANVEQARARGVNLAFFSGNEIFWKTRWESSIDGTDTPYRTLVCYKETHANMPIDPEDPPTWTGTWMDPRFASSSDGGRPQNALSGTLYMVNGGNPPNATQAIAVPQTFASLPFWRNTRVAQLAPGQTAMLAPGTLAYEWDENVDNGFRPVGLAALSSTTLSNVLELQDYGSTYATSTATHAMTLYQDASGALVFGAGTVLYSWGLDGHHDYSTLASTTDVAMQQATINLFSDMGVQPRTLQAGLVPGSNDVTAPAIDLLLPVDGTSVSGVVTLGASASDNVGVASTQFRLDGVAFGLPLTGNAVSMQWDTTTVQDGLHTLTAVARDAAGNTATSGIVTVLVANGSAHATCPCTIWSPAATPSMLAPDPNAVELGVKFRTDTNGFLTGLRFYKYPSNTGTHVGHLWSASGTLLGSVTFTNETASGWQQATFAAPIPVSATATYVASYHTDTGNYALTEPGLATAVDAPPLHALADGASGGNGVYSYGASAFPTQTWDGGNYWVDVVFDTEHPGDTTAPTVGITGPSAGSSVSGTVTVSATAADNVAIAGVQFSLDGVVLGAEDVTSPYAVTWDTTTAANGAHTLVAVARDSSGNTASASIGVSVSNGTTGGCPCSLWAEPDNPGTMAADPNPIEVGVRVQSDIDGYITAVRFHKSASNTGTHVAHLWSATGTLLGTATFANESASGWQQIAFATPIPIAANTTYVASYHSDTGNYTVTDGGIAAGINNPPLHALPDSAAGGNGVYAYGGSAFPSQSWNASNYWVDVVFDTAAASDTTPPTLNLTAPQAGGTVSGTIAVSATAADNVAVASVQFFVDGVALGAPVTSGPYATPWNTATAANGTHTIAAVARDTSGNSASASMSVTVSNVSGPTCPCSLWSAATTPGAAASDPNAVELGVKIRSDVDGSITGVRFYKYPQNTGTHTGHLWSSTGVLLGTVTFTNETASGWQQASFDTPIPVSAGTTYVASYHTDTGNYARTEPGFTVGVDAAPLHAPADGASGGNGVYAYGASAFPDQTWDATNYWVDVLFVAP